MPQKVFLCLPLFLNSSKALPELHENSAHQRRPSPAQYMYTTITPGLSKSTILHVSHPDIIGSSLIREKPPERLETLS